MDNYVRQPKQQKADVENSATETSLGHVLQGRSPANKRMATSNASLGSHWIPLFRQETMPADKPNKHELRTRQTRALLLDAAEKIFVRDGYEGAELGEIAALAGRTKGAIYAQFKSKEEIFLTLIRERRERYRSEIMQSMSTSKKAEQNLDTLRRFYIEQMQDPTWFLLLLEFKLFAIRHPEARPSMQSYNDESLPANQEDRLASFLGPARKDKPSISRTAAIQAMQPVLSALILESSYAPEVLDASTQEKIAARFFDALLDLPPEGS